MELQLALDIITIDETKKLLREIGNFIDIVEIGTPFVLTDGVRAIKEIRNEFPNKKILADFKIMDAGEHEAKIAFEAGADIVTVLGASCNNTITGCIKGARQYGKEVMVDMIDVQDIEKRTREVEELGVDYICVHTAFDCQSSDNPLDELKLVKSIVNKSRVAVAGGIKLDTIDAIVNEKPDIVVVGGGIMNEKDKKSTAEAIKKAMNGREV